MGFLQQLLSYGSICIQCHNSPDSDTLASASQEFRLTSYNAMLQSYSQFPNTLAQKLIKQALKPLEADYAASPGEMFWGDAIDVYPFENKTIGGVILCHTLAACAVEVNIDGNNGTVCQNTKTSSTSRV